jgi:hypothetical protein
MRCGFLFSPLCSVLPEESYSYPYGFLEEGAERNIVTTYKCRVD